jgi:outer membrane biosynthesis protein TonB
MYFDFEDYRPDTPSLTAPMTRREAVLLALLLHALIVILYLVMPPEWFQVVRVIPQPPPSAQQQLTYTRIEPLRNLPRLPKVEAPASDMDRKSATVEKPPAPTEPDPYSKGNTFDKVEGAPPAEKMKGAESPAPSPADSTTKPPPVDNGLIAPPKPAGGSLGQSLRNLQQYMSKDQNFDNQKGGQNTDTDAAIQFDSKGVDFSSWLRRFEQQVRRNWFIPQSAMMLSGHVVLTFYVHKNGAISDLQVITPSNVTSFNSSSFNALKLSNPTIPLPAEYPDEKAFFTVTFLYNERIR